MGYLRGRVQHVIHQTGSYCVLSFKVADTDFPVRDSDATVSGHLSGLTKVRNGVTLQIIGDWVKHPKYGRQFSPHGWIPWAPSIRDIQRFLADCIDGFEDWGLVRAIVEAFGENTFEVLSTEPDRVRGLSSEDTRGKY